MADGEGGTELEGKERGRGEGRRFMRRKERHLEEARVMHRHDGRRTAKTVRHERAKGKEELMERGSGRMKGRAHARIASTEMRTAKLFREAKGPNGHASA